MMVAAPKKTTHMQQRTFLLLQLLRNLVHNDSKTPNLSCLCHDALNYKTQQKLSKKPNATHSVTHLKVNFTIGQKSQIIWKKIWSVGGNECSWVLPFYYHFGFSFGFKIVACFREFFVAQHGTEAMICYFPSSSTDISKTTRRIIKRENQN